MGADAGLCDAPGQGTLQIHVAAGTYPASRFNLAHTVSILGVGAKETVLEGTVFGLRTGSVLRGVTVTKGNIGIVGIRSRVVGD